MQLTKEQEEEIFTGAIRENQMRRDALYDALTALQGGCSQCWFRTKADRGKRCEQSHCSIWRMVQEFQKMLRMRYKGKLDSWDTYAEAKNNDRLLFIDSKED